MSLDLICRHFARVLFIAATGIVAIAGIEWFANLAGFSVTGRLYSAGRLIELAAAYGR